MRRLLLIAALFGICSCAADIAGKWEITAKSPDGQRDMKVHLTLKSEDGKISGFIGNTEDEVPIEDARFSDPDLSFKIPTDEVTYEIKATVSGDSMKGTYTSSGANGTFTAIRVTDKQQ